MGGSLAVPRLYEDEPPEREPLECEDPPYPRLRPDEKLALLPWLLLLLRLLL